MASRIPELEQMLREADARGDGAFVNQLLDEIDAEKAQEVREGQIAETQASLAGTMDVPAAPYQTNEEGQVTGVDVVQDATPGINKPPEPPTPQLSMEERAKAVGMDPSELTVDPTEGMGTGEKMLVGAGQYFDETGRGAKQLYHYLAGNEEELKKLHEEEAEHRALDAPLLATKAGRFGQLATGLGTSFLPMGGLVRAGKLLKAGPLVTAGLEGGFGALQGAARPVIEEAERKANTAFGAGTGALLGGGMKIAKGVRGGVGKISEAIDTFTSGGKSVPGRTLQQKLSGKLIDPIMKKTKVRPNPNELIRIARSYRSSLPMDARAMLLRSINTLRKRGQSIPGRVAQEIRSNMGEISRDFDNYDAIARKGALEVQRVFDKAINKALPLKKRYALKLVRQTQLEKEFPFSATKPSSYRTPLLTDILTRNYRTPPPPEGYGVMDLEEER